MNSSSDQFNELPNSNLFFHLCHVFTQLQIKFDHGTYVSYYHDFILWIEVVIKEGRLDLKCLYDEIAKEVVSTIPSNIDIVSKVRPSKVDADELSD